uniref:Uncharacterized protein n=1 Tax=Lepeophtheirus salmonis TaxID=72036 RepID=A0A0K2UB54_LEPSM
MLKFPKEHNVIEGAIRNAVKYMGFKSTLTFETSFLTRSEPT